MSRMRFVVGVALLALARPAFAQSDSARGTGSVSPPDTVSIRIINTELRSAVQIMSQYMDRPVVFTAGQGAQQPVTFETPHAIRRSEVPRLLRGLVESQGYELVDDSAAAMYRVRPHDAPKAGSQPVPAGGAGGPARSAAALELFAIPLTHARASEVATTVNQLLGRTGTSATAGAGQTKPATLSDELHGNQVPPAGAQPAGAPAPESVAGTAGRAATLSGDVTIVPDPRANNLLVRANRADFDLIRAAVQQLDVRPLQVLIEVLVVEVQRNHNFDFGANATLPPTPLGRSPTTTVGVTQTDPVGLGTFVLSIMGAGGAGLGATLQAAETRGDVKILTRPVVLVTNNEQAEVNVGSQQPFVQVSRTLPTDNSATDQVVQYEDVGTKLTVTPTISNDGSVALDVMQEVSDATAQTQFNAPVIDTRSVRTRLLVQDGQTVALGGLSAREHDASQTGLPILSAIPIIGGLFGHASRSTTETELFLFITPRVIRTDADAAALTNPLRKQSEIIWP